MGQIPPKGFLPSAPYGASEATNALNPSQPSASNPQTPLLPPNFQDPGTMQSQSQSVVSQPGSTVSRNPFGGGRNQLMRGLFGAILFLLLAQFAQATTAVTGTIQNLGTGTIGTSGAFARFWLRGCAGNNPRVSSTAIIGPSQGGVYFFDFAANGSGVISGTLYSTRDVTGTSGGDIECGGSTTAVWYGLQVFVNGKGGPEMPVHAKNTATLDISNVTPIVTNPVITSPTGDTTYLRIDAGNSPVIGAVQFNSTNKTVNAGVFSNTQMNDSLSALLNSGSTQTEWTRGQGSTNHVTDAMACAIPVPSTGTVYQTNCIGAFVSSGGNSNNVVAVYGQFFATAATAHGWGSNFVCADGNFASITCAGLEIDSNIQNANTNGAALQLNGNFQGTNASNFLGVQIAKPNGSYAEAISVAAGASAIGLDLAQLATGNSQSSQSFFLHGKDAGGVDRAVQFQTNLNGQLNISTPNSQPAVFNNSVQASTLVAGAGTPLATTNQSGTGSLALTNGPAFTGGISVSGGLVLNGATSGTITDVATAIAGSNTLTKPAATGTYLVTGNGATPIQTKRVSTGSISGTTRANVTLTWTTTFADTNYTPTCSVLDSTTGTTAAGLVFERVNAVANGSIGVTVFNGSGGALTGTVFCTAIHD